MVILMNFMKEVFILIYPCSLFQVQELLRDDLKLLIMSATLDSRELKNLLGDVPVVTSQGKIYDVENIYLEANIKQPDYKSINTLL